jgi:uncharacterized protein YggU (UPF0235/DUF167 family)|tara:strand:- start:3749 stop:3970 length:222 start_codon:yes stop_codon:yes gene_type:complete
MYVRADVTPGAKKENITTLANKTFQIRVTEKRERNMANTRVRELLAKHFAVPIGSVRIVTGHRSTRKIINIDI